jgi:hypothetical protein
MNSFPILEFPIKKMEMKYGFPKVTINRDEDLKNNWIFYNERYYILKKNIEKKKQIRLKT